MGDGEVVVDNAGDVKRGFHAEITSAAAVDLAVRLQDGPLVLCAHALRYEGRGLYVNRPRPSPEALGRATP